MGGDQDEFGTGINDLQENRFDIELRTAAETRQPREMGELEQK